MADNPVGSDAAPAMPGRAASPAYRYYALGVLTLAYVSSHVDRNIVGIVAEAIKQDLGLSDSQIGFMSGLAFAIFYATLGIPIAMLADRTNRRNIIAIAVTIWSVMTAACGLAGNFWQLALARIGVGIGEAGSSPPSHSMIADLFPKEQRSGAMAIYALGVYFGIMIGFAVGGYVVTNVGWREAFFIVGLPGVIIALLVRFTIEEPVRGASDGIALDPALRAKVWEGFAHLWKMRAARHVVAGFTLTSMVGYGGVTWAAPFLIRTHEMTAAEAGLFLGGVAGIVGAIGAIVGGRLADRMARTDMRWNAWIVGVAKLCAIPFLFGFYLFPDPLWVILAYIPGTLLGAFYLGPSFALIQSLTPLHMRALASAITLFIVNMIGLGFGPFAVGVLSDWLRPMFETDSLRYALLFFGLINIWAAAHYFMAGRYLADDMKEAEAQAALGSKAP